MIEQNRDKLIEESRQAALRELQEELTTELPKAITDATVKALKKWGKSKILKEYLELLIEKESWRIKK